MINTAKNRTLTLIATTALFCLLATGAAWAQKKKSESGGGGMAEAARGV
jgi:hypothetical protein